MKKRFKAQGVRFKVKSKRFQLTTYYLLLTTLLVGCGYTTGSLLDPEIKTVAVPIFKNSISPGSLSYQYHPGVEVDITGEVIDRFLFDGNLRVVSPEVADLKLEGELIDYLKDPLRYSADGRDVTEYRLTLVVNLTLRNLRTDEVVWKEANFTGYTTYFTTGARAKSENLELCENLALSDAIEDLARNIVDRTVEGW